MRLPVRLSRRSQRIFDKITEGITQVGDHKRIGEPGDAFMPVSVEAIDRCHKGLIISVAHFYEQSGDLMADPMMTFLVVCEGESAGAYALTFQQDNLGINQVAMIIRSDGISRNAKLQSDLTRFANTWLQNIAEQQDL